MFAAIAAHEKNVKLQWSIVMVVESTDRCEVPRVGACSADRVVFCTDASRTMKRIRKITATAVVGCATWAAALQLSLPTPARVAVLLVRLLLLP
jgi:hypothetical protein